MRTGSNPSVLAPRDPFQSFDHESHNNSFVLSYFVIVGYCSHRKRKHSSSQFTKEEARLESRGWNPDPGIGF